MTTPETYLGDGVYASWDGWSVRLRAPGTEGDGSIYLEADTLRNLLRFTANLDATAHVPPA